MDRIQNQFNNNFAVIKMISNNPSRIQIINAKIFYNQSILSYRISYSENIPIINNLGFCKLCTSSQVIFSYSHHPFKVCR